MTDEEGLLALLHRLEQEFLDDLVPRLRTAANGHDAWVFVREATATKLGLGSRHAATGEQFATLAEEIIGLREDLALEDPSCPASRFLQYCDLAADPDDETNRGPQRMAQDLLKEIGRLPRQTA